MKKIFSFIIISLFLTSCTGGEQVTNTSNTDKNSKTIITTMPPLASISQYIAGEDIKVKSIIPSGGSPHHFELKPSHLLALNKSDLVVGVGLDIDSFILETSTNSNLLSLKDYVLLLEGEEHNHSHYTHEDEHVDHTDKVHHDEHTHEDQHIDHTDEEIYFDGHIWLSIDNGKIIAEVIKNNLKNIYPENSDVFEANYANFVIELENIQTDFDTNTENKNYSNFLIYHNAYEYTLNELGIDKESVFIIEETEGRDISPAKMKEIIDLIEKNNISVLFKDPLFDGKILSILENDYQLEILNLDPIGLQKRDGYLNIMKNNFSNIQAIYE